MTDKEVQNTTLENSISCVCIIVCVLLVMVLIINVTIVVKSFMHPERVPDFFGYKPFIVLSGSMEPKLLEGDIIVTKAIAPEQVVKGNIITFRSDNNTVVTHRVISVKATGGLTFYTKGDANTVADAKAVKAEELEGIYLWRIAGVGRIGMFLKTPIGILLFLITLTCIFIIYFIVPRNRHSKKEVELEEKLAALRDVRKN